MRPVHPLAILCLISWPATGRAQQLLGTAVGNQGERMGAAVAVLPDWNGDGYLDLLVSAPGAIGGGQVYVVSGYSLVTGLGFELIGIAGPPVWLASGSGFGASLAVLDDHDGDGFPEFAVGAPEYDGVGPDVGVVLLYHGGSLAVVGALFGDGPKRHFGHSMDVVGDLNGDGWAELLVGAPGEDPNPLGEAFVLDALGFYLYGNAFDNSLGWAFGSHGFGTSVASGFDLDHDGLPDIAVGSPYEHSFLAGADSGRVMVRPALGFNLPWSSYEATAPGEHLGAALGVGHDYDGDGTVDFVVGAPDWIGPSGQQEGRALVYSGASLATASDVVLYEHRGGAGGVMPGPGWRLGSSVAASSDLNGDGVGDYLVGMPDFYTQLPFGPGKGGVRVYSGATGQQLVGLTGANNDRLGDMLVGAVDDYNGDGFPELAVAGSLSDNPTLDCGRLNLYRLFPVQAGTYCTAKQNSLGCTPAIGSAGLASSSAPAPFLATCANVLNNKLGFLFYSHAPDSKPFQGGTRCVKAPARRTPVQNSGGSPSGGDCSGTFGLDFTPLIQGGPDPSLVAGAEIHGQYWSRDPLASFGASLSDGLRFVINP